MIAPPVLNEPRQTRRIECDQMEARMRGVCSACEAPVARYEVDGSGRCDRCRP